MGRNLSQGKPELPFSAFLLQKFPGSVLEGAGAGVVFLLPAPAAAGPPAPKPARAFVMRVPALVLPPGLPGPEGPGGPGVPFF